MLILPASATLPEDLITLERTALNFLSEGYLNGTPRMVSIDTETNHSEKERRDIRDGTGYAIGASITYLKDGALHSHYFPFRHKVGANYSQGTLKQLKAFVESVPVAVFHNYKFDVVSLKTLGIKFTGKWYDTMIMAHLLNENMPRSKSLDNCAAYYVSKEDQKVQSDAMDLIKKSMGWDFIPTSMIRPYAEQDTALTFKLANALWPLFEKEGLSEYWKYKARLIEVVIVMESRGVRINTELCNQMILEAEQSMFDYMDMIGGFNPASNKDMQELLIERLGLPIVKYTKRKDGTQGGPSFDKFAMELYETLLEASRSPLAEYILAYRGWSKAKGFYSSYLKFLSPDGRLRPSYKHHKDVDDGGTVTGRLSCADPNLQQIPKVTKKPWNGRIKQAFIPREGYSLWEVDYSQLELRLGAAYADDRGLKQIFREGRDVFSEMALALNMERQDCKTLVYSTQYGAGVTRIKTVFGITESEAKALKQNYFDKYPGFKRLADNCQNRAKSAGRVQLWSGRYRHFHNPQEEAHKAMNSVIQGGAADIVERQMIRCFDEIDQPSNGDCQMLLQVHDSIVWEIKTSLEEHYVSSIRAVMTDVHPNFDVVFDVQAKKWGE
jgi:DNA polymerase-1